MGNSEGDKVWYFKHKTKLLREGKLQIVWRSGEFLLFYGYRELRRSCAGNNRKHLLTVKLDGVHEISSRKNWMKIRWVVRNIRKSVCSVSFLSENAWDLYNKMGAYCMAERQTSVGSSRWVQEFGQDIWLPMGISLCMSFFPVYLGN